MGLTQAAFRSALNLDCVNGVVDGTNGHYGRLAVSEITAPPARIS